MLYAKVDSLSSAGVIASVSTLYTLDDYLVRRSRSSLDNQQYEDQTTNKYTC